MSGAPVREPGADSAGGARVTIGPDPASWQDLYRRLVEVVVPRPIALVASVDEEGRANLAPFSFFTVVSANPPCLAFAPVRSGRTGTLKDTLLNVRATGEFVVSVVTEEIAAKVNAAAAVLPRGESEFEHAGLTPAPASKVAAPLVAESPVNLECRLLEVRTYGEGPGAGSLVVGEIVAAHLHPRLLDGQGRVTPERLRAVGRMGGDLWVRTADTFSLSRSG